MSAPLPIITKLTEPPKLRAWYRVPAIRFDRSFGSSVYDKYGPVSDLAKVLWWPVTGRMHQDVEHFNFTHKHWHIDTRFVTSEHLKQIAPDYRKREIGRIAARLAMLSIQPLHAPEGRPEPMKPVLMHFRMVRHTQDWQYHENPTMQKFQSAFAGDQCRSSKAGWVCPHRQYPLGQIKPDANGIITCPLHGLRIHAASGIVAEQQP